MYFIFYLLANIFDSASLRRREHEEGTFCSLENDDEQKIDRDSRIEQAEAEDMERPGFFFFFFFFYNVLFLV
jgi:hypothetical protein